MDFSIFKIKEELSPGMLPRWWMGYAYHKINQQLIVYYLIPFNFIVALWRNIYFRLQRGMADKINEIYRKGYRKGYDEGWEQFDERFKRLEELLNEKLHSCN